MLLEALFDKHLRKKEMKGREEGRREEGREGGRIWKYISFRKKGEN
jgi:hypothetical protein